MKYRPRLKVYSSRNNVFDPETFEAYSYDWWKYVARIRGKIVFNEYRYSVTTAKHQSETKVLLDSLGIKVALYVDTRESLCHFKTSALHSFYESLYLSELKLSRKGIRESVRLDLEAKIKELKSQIKLARSLGAVFPKSHLDTLKKDVIRREGKRIEEARQNRALKNITETQARDLLKTGKPFQGLTETQYT